MSENLSGRTRHRAYKPFLRHARLILQVETTDLVTNTELLKPIPVAVTEWRDARIEDMVWIPPDQPRSKP